MKLLFLLDNNFFDINIKDYDGKPLERKINFIKRANC